MIKIENTIKDKVSQINSSNNVKYKTRTRK